MAKWQEAQVRKEAVAGDGAEGGRTHLCGCAGSPWCLRGGGCGSLCPGLERAGN